MWNPRDEMGTGGSKTLWAFNAQRRFLIMGTYTVSVSYIPTADPEALDWLENFSRSTLGSV